MSKRKQSSVILGYGELAVFEKLIARINHEFKTNPRYQRSVNSIDIRVRTAEPLDTVFDMIIDTKYYTFECELHVSSNEKDLRTKLTEKRHSMTVEGLIIAIDHSNSSTSSSPPSSSSRECPATNLIKSANLSHVFQEQRILDDSFGLSLLVHVGAADPNVKELAKKEMEKINEDFQEFELHLDNTAQVNRSRENSKEQEGDEDEEEDEEDDFSTLDELINTLFVHNWANMNRKSEKESHTKKEPTGNLYFSVYLQRFSFTSLKFLEILFYLFFL